MKPDFVQAASRVEAAEAGNTGAAAACVAADSVDATGGDTPFSAAAILPSPWTADDTGAVVSPVDVDAGCAGSVKSGTADTVALTGGSAAACTAGRGIGVPAPVSAPTAAAVPCASGIGAANVCSFCACAAAAAAAALAAAATTDSLAVADAVRCTAG